MNELGRLKRDYDSTPIPGDLESTVTRMIDKQGRALRRLAMLRASIASVAAVFLVFVAVVNLSPAAASAMGQIPVLKNLVRLVTFTELSYQDGNRSANVRIPEVDGLRDSGLGRFLNQKYLKEGSDLFEKFVEGYGEGQWSPQVLEANFKVKASTENIFAVETIVTEIAGSAKESVHYDNIDLENQIIITLPSLFMDDRYIDVISDNIRAQMRQQTNPAEGIMYFIKGESTLVSDGFEKIVPEQTFYINSDYKLVIVFNEYEVAPGSMGMVEFIVPTEAIQDLLVSNAYIR
ncbi:MAG: RsiV family protein [Bacillota bacterium]